MASEKYKEKKYELNRKDIGLYPYYIYQHTNIIPVNVFDIGSWNGNDAELLRNWFDIKDENVFCFDANPDNFVNMTASHPLFNNFNIAISDFNGSGSFYCNNKTSDNSSITKWNKLNDYREEKVEFFRMDSFIKKYDIKCIDICKIDVEGHTYDVLKGCGDELKIVKSLQIEAETSPMFDGEVLFSDISNLLIKEGFTMVEYYDQLAPNMCDSLWIKSEFLI